ncbi:NAD-dependent epimerase/dehydratase family protein [bacterium]|nr:NAD-dependent epimerase/dehydratase family protein [bacterium]NIN92323.1 NAD-dependent epimerase/dehydratase family protein [bacterium]NIO18445.1 NAD-dependent epimerase/dehydratase family protein [bacterium]NIO73438.1 NAD-dependent epimerase/dehydratase family protein [bacterium]
MKALVSGSNGFIGSHLVETLRKRGYSVTCLVRKTSNLDWLKGLDVEFVCGDCTEKETLYEAVKGADYVYHLAGVVRAVDRDTYYRVNFLGTKNLLEVCNETNPNMKKFIYLSTQAAVGPFDPEAKGDCHPITDYGKSKLQGEMAVNSFKDRLPVLTIRTTAIYGPRDKDIYTYFKFLKKGLRPVPGNVDGDINLLYVGDLIEGMILAAENESSSGQTYFLADEKSYSWEEASDKAAQALGVKAINVRIPRWMILTSAFLSELSSGITNKPPLLDRQKAKEILHDGWFCDITEARERLGFKPRVSLEEGLKITASWYKEKGWL